MATLLDRIKPTPATIPDPPTSPDSDLAALPGFSPPRALPPSMANPDEPPPATTTPPANGSGAGGSSGSAASIQGFFKARAKSYAKIAETLLKAAGGLLNRAAAGPDNDELEAFLPDDDDLETIPPPLGRLAARRVKFGADPDQLSDVEDLGMLAVGVLAWLGKGVVAVIEARRTARAAAREKAIYQSPEAQQ